jgi:hypothetical protein
LFFQRSLGESATSDMQGKPPQVLTSHPPADYLVQQVELATPSLPQRLIRHRNPVTGFLFSLFVHTVLIFGLLFAFDVLPEKRIGIQLSAEVDRDVPLHEHEQPTETELNTVQIVIPHESTSPLELEQIDVTTENESPMAQFEAEKINPVKEISPESAVLNPTLPNAPKLTMPTGGGLAGRDPAARGALAAAQGGSEASERAVEDGLRWILAHQSADGSWGFHHQKAGGCKCSHPGERESKTAATGLSLLAFLGAGYTHQNGQHQAVVNAGLKYLMKTMRSNGSWLGDSDKMYSHAIATIALAEAWQMTGDETLKPLAEKARHYIELAQNTTDSNRKGSWGYEAGKPGDITVTAWQLMALKSCQSAGLKTKPETWDLTNSFVDRLGSSDGTFGYDQPKKKTPATTAIGLFSKMHLGLHRESPLLVSGGDWLIDHGPSESDIYFNYYATQVMFHRQGDDWNNWNQKMRDYLIATQETGVGHLAGSWHFDDKHGAVGGRLYTTAMAILTLEVYYRYLPLYDKLLPDLDQAPRFSEASETPRSR